MDSVPDISFIIVNRNTKDLLLNCVRSVKDTVKTSHRIQVVDNGSTDGSVQALRALFPEVSVIELGSNAGFARANNIALSGARSKYAVLLNTDTVLTGGAADTMIGFMDNTPLAAACGGQLLNADGSLQNSVAPIPGLLTELANKSLLRLLWPSRFPAKRGFQEKTTPSEVESLIGACMAVRKKAIDDWMRIIFSFSRKRTGASGSGKRAGKSFITPEQGYITSRGRQSKKTITRRG
jgi:GT2 family glycosyltransferase